MGWVSILEPGDIAPMLDVSPDWRFMSYLCLGYPAEQCDVPELKRRGWQARGAPQQTRFTRSC